MTFEPGEREVKPAFIELAKLSGNPFDWSRSSQGFNGSVAFTEKPTTYWEALEDLCRQSNTAVHFYDDPSGRGATLMRGAVGGVSDGVRWAGAISVAVDPPFAAAGNPFRRRRTRHQDSCVIAIQMHWEQRAGLCRYRGKPDDSGASHRRRGRSQADPSRTVRKT